VAGVYLANFTKNTTIKNGESVYDDATLFEFTTWRLFKQASWITILNKEKIFVLLLTNSITKK
jgi:hypothetical protein